MSAERLLRAGAVLLLLGSGAWLLLPDNTGNPGSSAARTTGPTATSASPTGLFLDPAAFIGRPADDVQREMQAAGLVVRQEEADPALLRSLDRPLDAGDVAGLQPVGIVADSDACSVRSSTSRVA